MFILSSVSGFSSGSLQAQPECLLHRFEFCQAKFDHSVSLRVLLAQLLQRRCDRNQGCLFQAVFRRDLRGCICHSTTAIMGSPDLRLEMWRSDNSICSRSGLAKFLAGSPQNRILAWIVRYCCLLILDRS